MDEFYLTMDMDLKFVRKGERVAVKHAHCCNHVVFLKRCVHGGLVPKGLRLKVPVKSPHTMRIKLDAERKLVRERLRYWNHRRSVLYGQLLEFKASLFSNSDNEASAHNWKLVLCRKEAEYQRTKAKQMRKFSILKMEKELSGRGPMKSDASDFMESVVNLSSVFLTTEETKLLGKGLKFVPTPTDIPYEEVIVGVEEIATKLDAETAEELRCNVRGILMKAKLPTDNLSQGERKALNSLRTKKKQVVISKADKGNSTVVMDKLEYQEKLKMVTMESGFVKLEKDVTEKEGRKLVKLLMEFEKKGEIDRAKRLSLTVKALKCPVLFGLPKIHKPGVPLRPIVSYVDSPTYLVAKELARILRPIHGNSDYNVKDSGEMCDFLHRLRVPEGYVFASYDVVNLFGSVPAEEAAELAIRRLRRDESLGERTSLTVDSIAKLLFFCVRSNYFKCNGVFFRTSTCPMGSPLSPALASIFMESFEDSVVEAASPLVLAWKRYVDDTFVVIKEGGEDTFLAKLNGHHNSIKFTCEKEAGKVLAFLDIKIKRSPEGVRTSVYRKNTYTDRYLDYSSSHCSSVKWGLVSCLGRRAERICRVEEDQNRELAHLRDVFNRNGYPARTVEKRLRRTSPRVYQQDEEVEKPVITIPFVSGMSEKLSKAASRLGLRVRFRKGLSLGSIFGNSKLDKVSDLEKGGVIYKQVCEDCERVYIGETGRRAIVRKREHEKDVREMNERSAIAEHCHRLNHKIDFSKFTIIGLEKCWTRRRLKEGIEISKHKTFNRDEGLHVDKRWRRFLF